jgi:hypothetical protein
MQFIPSSLASMGIPTEVTQSISIEGK